MARTFADSALGWPSSIQARGYGDAAYAIARRGLGQCHSLSECGQMSILPRVCALLFSRGPFAVFLAIWAIVIFTLQRMPLTRAVGIEILKRLPAFANQNAAAAISRIVCSIRFLASAPHVDPNTIDRSALHTVLGVYALANGASNFAREAPAAFRYPALNVVRNYESLRTAVTTA